MWARFAPGFKVGHIPTKDVRSYASTVICNLDVLLFRKLFGLCPLFVAYYMQSTAAFVKEINYLSLLISLFILIGYSIIFTGGKLHNNTQTIANMH